MGEEGRQPPADPLPANVLAIDVEQPIRRSQAVDLDRLSRGSRGVFTGAIALDIEALTPLYSASGAFELTETQDALVKAPLRRGGVPCIAGSSIKGACRQVFELLTQSDDAFSRDNQPLSQAKSLFGVLGHRGRISFDDAVPREPWRLERRLVRVPHEPSREAGRRFYLPAPQPGSDESRSDEPRTLPVHALAAGTRLSSTLRFTETAADELGLLLLSLGIGHFQPRLGGAKYDDLGRVRYTVSEISLRQGFGRDNVLPGESARSVFESWMSSAKEAMPAGGRAALATLVEHMPAGPAAGARR